MRFLFWLLLAALVYFALRKQWQHAQNGVRHEEQRNRAQERAAGGQTVESMLACAHCHVYFPASDAVNSITGPAGLVFCCEEHRRLHGAA